MALALDFVAGIHHQHSMNIFLLIIMYVLHDFILILCYTGVLYKQGACMKAIIGRLQIFYEEFGVLCNFF